MKSYKNLSLFLALIFYHTTYAAYEGQAFGFIIIGVVLLFIISISLGLSWIFKFFFEYTRVAIWGDRAYKSYRICEKSLV